MKMYVAREDEHSQSSSSDERRDESEGSTSDSESTVSGGNKERLATTHSNEESLDEIPYGSQYSSEGELYDYSSYLGSGHSDAPSSERMYAVRELSSDEASEIPEHDHKQGLWEPEGSAEGSGNRVEFLQVLKEKSDWKKSNQLTGSLLPHSWKMKKLMRKMTRPLRTKKHNQCFVTMVNVNGTEALALLDSGCTSDLVAPEFVAVTNLKVYELEEPVPLQLGTVGSRSKINFGLEAKVEVGSLYCKHYFNVVNIDWYDLILGTLFMRKHDIVLDFEKDEVRIRGKTLKTIVEGESTYQQACQYSMRKTLKGEADNSHHKK